jgi:hypothetical protein
MRDDLLRLQELAARLGYADPSTRVGTLWNRVKRSGYANQLPPRYRFRAVEHLAFEDALQVVAR